ncbi:MAG: hypothetical protein IIC56_10255, partial [Proteobacteria bacterium]|nr:hypothetical protein [Pseudomonadota bacterium]
MTSEYLKHVRSLERLHEMIEDDPASGGKEAVERLVKDIEAVSEKISQDAEKV